MFSEMLSRFYSAFWNYFLQFKSSLLRKKKTRERETCFMFSSPTFAWQRIATHNSRTPDLTLIEQCFPATGFACWWSAVLWSFQPHWRLSLESGQTGLSRCFCQACPGAEIFASHLLKPHISSKLHAPPGCPKSAESTVTTNTAACGTHEWQKKQECTGPSQREQGEKLVRKNCPPCRGWTNNSTDLVRDQPDQVSPTSLGKAATAIIHSTV